MATAPAQQQQMVLDLQALDTRITQARHRKDNLPVLAQIAELSARAQDLDTARMARTGDVADLQREVAKADDDVTAVRARYDRDTVRLNSGDGTPKDLQALQSELEVLARRLSDLEDAELDVMERLEQAQGELASAAEQHKAIMDQIAELEKERDNAVQAIDTELAQLQRERDELAGRIDADLLALYAKLQAQYGGVGAAALRGNTCEGCHMTLNPADVERIRALDPDQVVRCEECGRILVRGESQ